MKSPCLPHLYVLIAGLFLALAPFVVDAVLMFTAALV